MPGETVYRVTLDHIIVDQKLMTQVDSCGVDVRMTPHARETDHRGTVMVLRGGREEGEVRQRRLVRAAASQRGLDFSGMLDAKAAAAVSERVKKALEAKVGAGEAGEALNEMYNQLRDIVATACQTELPVQLHP
jgi:hypothetical protein